MPPTPAFAPRHAASYAGGDLPTHVLCYDIETYPDPAMTSADDGTAFPKPLRHKVACISVVVARIDRRPEDGIERFEVEDVRSGGDPDWDEGRLLKAFWALLAARPYRLVGWNTRRFDMPVLQMRSLVHGLDAGIYWRRGDRWTGYDARNSGIWAIDLMDKLASHGAAPPHGLDEVARALGLPGKMGEHGGAVADMVAAGDIARVRRYCETDVVNTYACLLAYLRLTGRLGEADRDAALDSLRRCLTRDPEGAPHLADFARRWKCPEVR